MRKLVRISRCGTSSEQPNRPSKGCSDESGISNRVLDSDSNSFALEPSANEPSKKDGRAVLSPQELRGPLFSYKMTDDHGFAPNPFWGVLTLATCKPQIRLHKGKGVWIAGFTSGTLCGDVVGAERLIYLMLVTERKMTIADYFYDPRYERKIPDVSKLGRIYEVGDNIYKPSKLDPSGFERIKSPFHIPENFKRNDLSGKYVLASTRFYYFGKNAIRIPNEVRPSIPVGQSGHGSRTQDEAKAKRFIEYVSSNFDLGVHGAPDSWPDNDRSWQNAIDI